MPHHRFHYDFEQTVLGRLDQWETIHNQLLLPKCRDRTNDKCFLRQVRFDMQPCRSS